MGNRAAGRGFGVLFSRDPILLLESQFKQPRRAPIKMVVGSGAWRLRFVIAGQGHGNDIAGDTSDFGHLSAAKIRQRAAKLVEPRFAPDLARKNVIRCARDAICRYRVAGTATSL